MGQQVLDIQDATDVVAVVLIDGDARIVVLDNALDDLRERHLEVEVDHILTRGHNLLGGLVAKAHNAFQHALLFLDVLLVGQLQSLLQVADAQHMVFLLHHLPRQHTRAQQDIGYRPEQAAAKHDAANGSTAETQRRLSCVDLRHNLAEQQQQECEQYRDAQEMQPIGIAKVDDMCKEVVAQHDDGDVDQIVGNQDRGQRAF